MREFSQHTHAVVALSDSANLFSGLDTFLAFSRALDLRKVLLSILINAAYIRRLPNNFQCMFCLNGLMAGMT